MTVLTWDNHKVSSFRWKKVHRASVFASIFGSQSMEGAGPLWEVNLSGVPQYWPEAHQMMAFLESFDGYKNPLELWNLVQPVPLGTMRGAMVLNADAAQGATSLVISAGSGQAGTTLLKGDLLGLGNGITQQVIRVSENATADGSGVITVQIGTPLRNAFASGAAVTWNKPKALFRQKTLNEGIEYQAVIGQPWTLSLIEDWRAA
jgi:hypothetical protein